SSILGPFPPSGVGQSGVASDLWGSSSRVDLLKPGAPLDVSSGSLQRTDEVYGPPMVRPPSADSQTVLGGGPESGYESSAVDLGGQPADLPFPLGVDSSVGSSLVPGRPPQP